MLYTVLRHGARTAAAEVHESRGGGRLDIGIPGLRPDETAALQLRALFEHNGYSLYRTGSFEEYDLYMQNRSFLSSDDIVTLSSRSGRLMALRPDVTLSIVKNTSDASARRLYYNTRVFRQSRTTGEYREINQIGLEFIGGGGIESEAEVLRLACSSLSPAGPGTLDVSHMEFVEALLRLFPDPEHREEALTALRDKSPHVIAPVCLRAGLPEETAARLGAIAALSGPFLETLPEARALSAGIPGAGEALLHLKQAVEALGEGAGKTRIRLDFSIVNDAAYYSGLIFQGYLEGIPHSVLSGGRYDNLMRRFSRDIPGIGFAFYLDDLGRDGLFDPEGVCSVRGDGYLNVALPKGRMGDRVLELFAAAGLPCADIEQDSRRLIFEDPDSRTRFFLVKPSDVGIYVERGAADIGAVGKDVLLEGENDVLEALDLRLGKCRFAVAGKPDFKDDYALPLRVATKYPNYAARWYAARSRPVEIIELNGSIELAPLIGLSDVIVDIVETGSTIKENGLAVLEDLGESSARLIANRASWRFKGERIRELARKLEEVLGQAL